MLSIVKMKSSGVTFRFFIIFLFFIFIPGVCSLRNMRMTVPEAVELGGTITLSCDYDLESVPLYAIKWYRNGWEFYRYTPKESPPTKVFIIPHLKIDVSKSNSQQVTLQDVERETGGLFQCEATSDAPLFHTDMRSAKLVVAEIPDEEPVLRTDVNKITPGARFSANCTTPGSFPSMNITWFINNNQVKLDNNISVQNSVVFYDALPGLETVRSTIAINLTHDFFKNSRMRVACRATIFNLYNKTKELEIIEDAPQLAPIREHSTHTVDGLKNDCKNNKECWIVESMLFILISHLWMRRISAT